MDPLYTTQTAYTFDEYKKLNKKFTMRKIFIIILMVFLLTVLFTVLFKSGIYLILMPLYLIVFCIIIDRNLKKTFYADKYLQKNGLRTYNFYESYFEEKTNNSYTKFDYECIYSIVESKTNFYILKAPNQAFIIVKNNCSPELIEFILNLKNKKQH